MRLKILLIFIVITLTTKGEELPYIVTNGTFDKKTVLKQIKKEIKKSKRKHYQASYSESSNGDTVVFFKKETAEGLKIKYVFNIPPLGGSKAKYCGIQEYHFDCSPCATKYLNEIIANCGFRKTLEQKYLSNYFNQTELEVIKNSEETECIVLICRYVDKKKDEYEALYNSLKEDTSNE